jgi:tetratricopeptide (TPR) repeat protein
LDAATADDARDVAAWEAKAAALMLIGRPADAEAACTAALGVDPERETTLFLASILAMQRDRAAEARDTAVRLIRVNPWMWQYRQMLAESSAQLGDWRQTADECRQALRLEPANLPCRQLLIRALLRLGDMARVRAELELCLSLMPPADRERYRQSVEQQLR